MRVSCFLFFCVLSFQLFCQQLPEKGRFTDSIPVSGKVDESYAVYLPNSFDESTLSPIIFVFEPAARTAIGIRPFIPAAEKYGIVVVCSNNSRNGGMNDNFRLAENLFAEIFRKYNIDAKRMFLAGFSGGSRLASAIATLTNQFAGVIACGAGFSGNASEVPSTQEFAYAGLCGDEDMNYREMLGNKAYLSRVGFTHTLFSFEGGHRWPPQQDILKALDWLFLQQALKNNDKEAVLSAYHTAYDNAGKALEGGKLLFAEEAFGRILKSYGKSLDVDSVAAKRGVLLKSASFKSQKTAFDKAAIQEEKLNKKLLNRFFEIYNAPKKANLKWWQKEFDKLAGLALSDDSYIKKMAARVRNNIYAAAAERGNPNLFQSSKEQLVFCRTIRDMVYSKK